MNNRTKESPTIAELIERHYQQIDLFYYQNRREIPRPKTTIVDVFVWSMVYFFIIAVCVVLNITADLPLYYELPASIVVYLFVSEFSLRLIGIKVVECYQHYAKEATRRNCLCVPSCSEYAILCFKKHPLIYALLKIRKRLFVTCKGTDYIIDRP